MDWIGLAQDRDRCRTLVSAVMNLRVPCLLFICGPGSLVGIATELRAGRPGIESRWGQDFPSVQTGLGAHPAS